jgi:microcystin-dependent protein
MVYTAHSWVEYAGSGTDKAGWLNNMETQYDEIVDYCDTTTHNTLYYTTAECDAKYFGPSTDGTGSGFVIEYLDGYSGDELLASGIPKYSIGIWSGAVGDIPSGWHACDGRDAYTPDLRDRFVVGAGDTYNVTASGGSNTIASSAKTVTIGTHALTTGEIPAHAHTTIADYTPSPGSSTTGVQSLSYYSLGVNSSSNAAYTDYTGGGTAHGHSGSTLTGLGTTGNNMPPYKAYYFIIKD